MVKAVTGEESRLQLAEDRLGQSGLPVQVGLIIGKLSSVLDRGFVFDLVPTPPNDAAEPPCSLVEGSARDEKKKGSKAKSSAPDSSSLFIDKDWVAEHARQVNDLFYSEKLMENSDFWYISDKPSVVDVSRLLVGGIKVIGIYVWVGDAAFKNSTIVLCQTVKGVAEAAPLMQSDRDERLIIHICCSPRRWTCRNCSLASIITSNSLRPCEFKMGRVLTSLQAFRCMYNFTIRMPVKHDTTSTVKTLNDLLHSGIMYHAKELKDAEAVIDGKLVIKDQPCTTEGLHEVELLLPFMKGGAAVDANSQKEVAGILILTGSLCSYAYLTSKESCSQALADIKEDIISSLKSRLEIICDEADVPEEAGQYNEGQEISSYNIISQPLRTQCTLAFPRRVFIPWLGNTFICNYIQPSETFEAVKDHFVELLSMESPEDVSKILQPESESPSLRAITFWDAAFSNNTPSVSKGAFTSSCTGDNNSAAKVENSGKPPESGSVNIKIAGFILLLSILVGLFLYSNRKKSLNKGI